MNVYRREHRWRARVEPAYSEQVLGSPKRACESPLNQRRTGIRNLVAAWACAGFALGCRSEASTSAPPPPQASAVAPASAAIRLVNVDASLIEAGRIQLSKAELRPISDELLVTGQVIAPPHGKAEIGALLNARIRKIFVEEGQSVKRGQALASLDAPDAARIAGELANARARRGRAELVLAQEQRLAEQSATSERAVSEANSEAAAARADEQAAESMLGTYDVRGSQLTLRTPLAGVVARNSALLGAQVDADTILFRIVDPAQLVVRADVPESIANRIRFGVTIEIRLPTPGEHCGGVILSSTRSVDPIKRTVGFRIKPSEQCPTLLEGGFADVLIPLDVIATDQHHTNPSPGPNAKSISAANANASATNVNKAGAPADVNTERVPTNAAAASKAASVLVAIPRAAVVEIDSVPVAFVATGAPGQFRVVLLTVAHHGETTTWVEQGLLGGEQVASRGVLLLKGEWMKSRLE
jgi:cobalt-zinc-cadmium efflux system membrane fusion protein